MAQFDKTLFGRRLRVYVWKHSVEYSYINDKCGFWLDFWKFSISLFKVKCL